MPNFLLSCFADEVSADVEKQIEAIKRNGFTHIEPRNVDGTNISDLTVEQAQKFKAQLDAAGIKVSSLGSPIGKIDIYDDFEPHFEKFMHSVEIAKILGTDKIRLFSFFVKDGKYEEARDEVLRRMQRMCDYAVAHGIKCCHENEKGIYGDSYERVVDLLDNVDGLYSVFDPANYIQCEQRPGDFVDKLASRTEYGHIKDALFDDGSVVPSGCGDGEIAKMVAALARQGDDVILTLEPHLFIFTGLSNLQDEELKHKYVYNSPDEAFDAAASALKKIIFDGGFTI